MGQELYELYENLWAERGVGVEGWPDLADQDKQFWEELADELEGRGWKGA